MIKPKVRKRKGLEGRERKMRRRRNLWSRKDSCGQWGKPPGGVASHWASPGPTPNKHCLRTVVYLLYRLYTDRLQWKSGKGTKSLEMLP